jgi:hypothetical protein
MAGFAELMNAVGEIDGHAFARCWGKGRADVEIIESEGGGTLSFPLPACDDDKNVVAP